MNRNSQIAILLGAGSSLPADFPSTQSLTDKVLSGDCVRRHTDGNYYINQNQPVDEVTKVANCVTRRIYSEAERYYAVHAERRPNYEDVLYLLSQVQAEETGEAENPAIHAFTTGLRHEISTLISSVEHFEYSNLLEESHNYVTDIVWHSLCRNANTEGYLKIFEVATKLGRVNSISTLCHDTHVESFLRKSNISLSDGFSDEKAGVRYWNGNFISAGKIPFFKLHGSINWFRFRPKEGKSWYDDVVGIPLSGDINHVYGNDGKPLTPLDSRPILLAGTFNKIQDYTRGIFHELHCQFRQSIDNVDQLLVSGYSFGDKGINSQIINWYYAKRGRRLIIIHPNPKSLFKNARNAIRSKWQEWDRNEGIRLIRKNLENVQENELLEVVSQYDERNSF